MKRIISVLDSTLRDGAQNESVSFSVNDKLKIASLLDDFGISYTESGIPASNKTDADFFECAKKIEYKKTKLCAFSSTVRKGLEPCDDDGLRKLLDCGAPVCVICGKASARHAEEIIGISRDDNLSAIKSTVKYIKSFGREVIFDAEHFFDEYKNNRNYSLSVISAAKEGGADIICLCDTNGGSLPFDIETAVRDVCDKFRDVKFGIHCHDDCGCAVASSIAAIRAGAVHIQGTMNGLGERCGNANLSTLIPNIALKTDFDCDGDISKLFSVAAQLAEIANKPIHSNKPYVGRSAFAHKGGIHTDGVMKFSSSYEHIDPELVGNRRRFLLSEVAGRSTVLSKLKSLSNDCVIDRNSPQIEEIVDKIKMLEHNGYQFEAADASFELIVKNTLGTFRPHFKLILYKVIDEYPFPDGVLSSSATIKIDVDGATEITASLGNGPVNALDLALRKAISVFYPEIKRMFLSDYKVRVLDDNSATASLTRVIIESSDGRTQWSTVGVSHDIIEASLIALIDSVEYFLHFLCDDRK